MLTFPSKTQAQDIYQSGLDHTIDNYGKSVTLFFPAYLQAASGAVGPGNIGDNFLSNGSTSFFPADNFLAGSGSGMMEVRDSKEIKMLCTVTSQNREARFRRDENINIDFKKELAYIYTKCYASEHNNILNCDYAIFSMPNSGIDQMKFRRASHPRDKCSLVQGRYINCWWEQIP